ncbi:MAG TPA: SGNH hydrolase domain-containing protein [Baekduia sp.]|nr:SGNH hydrolase domain-containing protein [Baekduia sp.]
MPARSSSRPRGAVIAALVVMAALVAPGAAAAAGATPRFGPPAHGDARDAAGAPVDLRSVAFGQRETQLTLRVRAQQPWLTHDVVGRGRSLCLVLARGAPARTVGRACLASASGRAELRYQHVDPLGRGSRWRAVDAVVVRPDRRTLRATFPPYAVGLARGRLRWHVELRWRRPGTCAAGCQDRVPDAGALVARVAVLAEPRCFGAAARGACRNPALRGVVLPLPRDAPLLPDGACRVLPEPPGASVLEPCAFGVQGPARTGTVALLGDSHARHWRAALEVVAQARRWRAVSVTRPGCPFSVQIPRSPALGPATCAQQHAEAMAWLRANPQIRTIFVSSWAEPPSGPQGGLAGYGGGPAAFGAMLDRVPASVRHIYVLRDIPGTSFATPSCVTAAMRRGSDPGSACAVARGAALVTDPLAQAGAARAPRVRVVDLTRRLCDARRCRPVVGGAYVYKDDNHMNAVFATTLGPYVLRALG